MGSYYRGSKEEIRALSAFINLSRASESLMARQVRRLAKEGLTLSQWGVLETLYHLGAMSQKALGTKLLKSAGNITMVVNNLSKLSLVSRRRDKSDRRFYQIHLTAKGRRLVGRLLPVHVAGIVGDMSRLDGRQQEELRRLCRELDMTADND
jgi:MarR family 2-MHQ and catechol resistance regulon transcriptional repressor